MKDINFLLEYINLVTLGICLCVGFALKQAFTKFNNQYIPLVMLLLGMIINVITSLPDITAGVILGGMISGLASTGCYEMLRNLLKRTGTASKPEDDEIESGKEGEDKNE